MKKVLIMSAKYAPGHFSHMLAYYKLFEYIGINPILFIDEKYHDFINEYKEYRSAYLSEYKLLDADYLFIYNMSTIDMRYVKHYKKMNSKLKVYFIYHEPWFGVKKWLNDFVFKKESVIDSIKTFGRFMYVKKLLKNVDLILLPSGKAAEYYKQKCIKYNSNYCIFPLVFTDEANEINIAEKKYFSFISTASNSKNWQIVK